MPSSEIILSSKVRRPHQTFVNAHGQRYGEDALGGPHEYADCLHGVPHDVLGLGVGVGLLMQQLDAGHLLARLGHLDAVSDQDAPAIDA
jgi:hypothetical protein